MTGDDMALMREYAQGNSEPAFATLVSRHVNLVYSVARRQVGDPHLAEEITQAVFIILARKAKSLGPGTILPGWLCRTARNASADVLKLERRRQLREQEAHMQSILNEPDSDAWSQLAPHLDEALSALGEKEHNAVVLRFFEGRQLKEVGAAMGVGEDAARMRVNRGLEKLRRFLTRKGVTLSATAIAAAVSANSVQAAPAGLAAALTTAALSGGALTTTAVIAATKAVAMTTLQKTAITAIIVAAVGAGIYQARQTSVLRDQVQTFGQKQALLTGQIRELNAERDDATNRLAKIVKPGALSDKEKTELLRLRGEVTRLKADSQELALFKAAALSATNEPAETAIKTWIARTADLQKKIGQLPGAQIPEFEFLAASDWLDVAKDASLETDQDIGNAAQILGAEAKDRFAGLIRDALKKFLGANGGELPTSLTQILPFIPQPVGDDLLQRYELLQSGNVENLPETDRNFRIIGEKRTAPAGSGSPILQIGTGGFVRTGQ